MTFSVIIPVYNVAPYLKACLDSVYAAAIALASDEKGEGERRTNAVVVEVICVDDGSTDGSGQFLDDYLRSLASTAGFNLRIVHQPNSGVSAARNRGLELATGEWLMFLDADDVYRDSIFEDLSVLIAEHDKADLFGFGLTPMPPQMERPAWNSAFGNTAEIYDLRRFLPDHCAVLSACRFLLNRTRFGDIRFPPYAHGEDLVYVANLLARAKSLIYLQREEYGYRNRPESAVHVGMTPEVARDAVRFHVAMFRILADSGKSLGPCLWQMRVAQWILRLPIALSRHWLDSSWNTAWIEWRDSMRTARRLPYVRGVCRAIALMAAICPIRPPIALASRIGIRWMRYRGT